MSTIAANRATGLESSQKTPDAVASGSGGERKHNGGENRRLGKMARRRSRRLYGDLRDGAPDPGILPLSQLVVFAQQNEPQPPARRVNPRSPPKVQIHELAVANDVGWNTSVDSWSVNTKSLSSGHNSNCNHHSRRQNLRESNKANASSY